MTPITREQALTLAVKHGILLTCPATAEYLVAPEELAALLTDFHQQVIADLEKMNSGLPAFKIMALQAKLEQSEARARELEKDAARWNHYRNLAGPEAPNPFWCLRVIPGEVDRLADAALNKEPGHEAPAI